MNIKNENYHKADLLLYHISLAADNLENLAAALEERYSAYGGRKRPPSIDISCCYSS